MKINGFIWVLATLLAAFIASIVGGNKTAILLVVLAITFGLFLFNLESTSFAILGAFSFIFWVFGGKENLLLILPLAALFLFIGIFRQIQNWRWTLGNMLLSLFFGALFALQIAQKSFTHYEHMGTLFQPRAQSVSLLVMISGVASWAALFYYLSEKQKKEWAPLRVLDTPATKSTPLSKKTKISEVTWLFSGLFFLVFASVSSWVFLFAFLCFRIVFESSKLKKVMGLFWNFILPLDWLLLLGTAQLLSWKLLNPPNFYMNIIWQSLMQSLYALAAGALAFNSLLNVMSPPTRQAPKRSDPAPGLLLHQ